MDYIKIGLDFGTHQTKICAQITPDEGHGEPRYEFFQFEDLAGQKSYFLPSVVQINDDDTLSYGYVERSMARRKLEKPILNLPDEPELNKLSVEMIARALYNKYATPLNSESDMAVLEKVANIVKEKVSSTYNAQMAEAQKQYDSEILNYQKETDYFRYFKQATFSQRVWKEKLPSKILSIWYLTYVIFLLEEKYGQNFSINMGIPADENDYESKKKLAVEILATAYYLVEEVYGEDVSAFLNEKVSDLLHITDTNYQHYSDELKEGYNINIFPEAYAGLISLTSKGKLATGMSITADIGGGTTDVSFFTIQGKMPVIYRYWSLPIGLNYLAEESGFDYFAKEGSKVKFKNKVIEQFNKKKENIIINLIHDLQDQFYKEATNVPASHLSNALNDRIVVYNGGGSAVSELTTALLSFNDVKVISSSLWKEENIKDKEIVAKLCPLLSTAYGLSLAETDDKVKLEPFTSLFNTFPKRAKSSDYDRYIDKDRV